MGSKLYGFQWDSEILMPDMFEQYVMATLIGQCDVIYGTKA